MYKSLILINDDALSLWIYYNGFAEYHIGDMPLFRVMSYYMFFRLYGTLSIASCHNSRLGNFSIFRSICIQKPTDGFE